MIRYIEMYLAKMHVSKVLHAIRKMYDFSRCSSVKYGTVVVLLVGFSCITASSQTPEVMALPDSTEMLIGDHLDFTISVTQDGSDSIIWPFFLDSLGGFEILEKKPVERLTEAGRIAKMQTLVLTAFDSGMYEIPPLTFQYIREGRGDTLNINTPPSLVEVHSVKVDTAQSFKPIKEIRSAPLTMREILPWLLVGLVALLIIGALVYWFYFRKKDDPVFAGPPPPKIPPHEIAMRKLAKLEQKKLWQEGEIKAYYVELTEILREYLEGRYEVHALESTTDEILYDLSTKEIPVRQMEKLKELLVRADFTKFAKLRPGPSENMLGMEVARTFIKETKNFAVISDDEDVAEDKSAAGVSQ